MDIETRKRGRPKKGNCADSTLPPIRVTSQQKESYQLSALKEGLSLSAWLKKVADENVEGK